MITVKLVLLLYTVWRTVTGDSSQNVLVVLFLLVYVSLNMVLGISKKRVSKVVWLGVAIGWSLVGGVWLKLSVWYFLPVNLMELFFLYGRNRWLPAFVIALPLGWLRDSSGFEYGLIGAFSYLVCLLVAEAEGRIGMLGAEKDRFKDEAYRLAGELKRNSDYEEQLRDLSKLEERNKIAQMIHDKIGHTISGSLIQLEAAKLVMDGDPVKAKRVIETVIAILRVGMENLRITLKNIKPTPEQMGVNKVKHMLKDFESHSQIQTVLTCQGNLERISQMQWRIVYENLNEALTNIIKHAKASRVMVNIEVLNRYVKAAIKDNGCGCGGYKKGIGIGGMEERSGNAGGKVIVDGSNGFSVITLLPLEGE